MIVIVCFVCSRFCSYTKWQPYEQMWLYQWKMSWGIRPNFWRQLIKSDITVFYDVRNYALSDWEKYYLRDFFKMIEDDSSFKRQFGWLIQIKKLKSKRWKLCYLFSFVLNENRVYQYRSYIQQKSFSLNKVKNGCIYEEKWHSIHQLLWLQKVYIGDATWYAYEIWVFSTV